MYAFPFAQLELTAYHQLSFINIIIKICAAARSSGLLIWCCLAAQTQTAQLLKNFAKPRLDCWLKLLVCRYSSISDGVESVVTSVYTSGSTNSVFTSTAVFPILQNRRLPGFFGAPLA